MQLETLFVTRSIWYIFNRTPDGAWVSIRPSSKQFAHKGELFIVSKKKEKKEKKK